MNTRTYLTETIRLGQRILLILLLAASTAASESLIKPKARIVFVGDSITGLSINFRNGFNHQMRGALSQRFEGQGVPELVSLGGSGQGVSSWMNVAKKSIDQETFLDIKGVDVKASLEKKADIMIFMLGMNDILCPYVKPTDEDMNRWASDYMKLIDNLRRRAKPDIVALASITLLTDALGSPKDVVRKQLNERVRDLADKHSFVYLQTGEEMEKLLQRGRQLDPKFRPTYDFVHPNTLGHAAISVAMLEGLGDKKSANILRRKYFDTGPFDLSREGRLSYDAKLEASSLDSDVSRYAINYRYTPKVGNTSDVKVSLCMQSDNQAIHQQSSGPEGTFHVSLTVNRPKTSLTLSATSGGETLTRVIDIPMPWLVAAGIPHKRVWHGNDFRADNDVLECEKMLIGGKGFNAPLIVRGGSYPWQRYAASINYSGFDNPDSLAWYATTYCNTFDAAYATRWIYSAKERHAQLELGHDTFSSTIGLSLWINGKALEPVFLTRSTRKRQYRGITLNKGWNHLLLRSDHTTWQWQHICSLKTVGEDTPEDIRYSIVPK